MPNFFSHGVKTLKNHRFIPLSFEIVNKPQDPHIASHSKKCFIHKNYSINKYFHLFPSIIICCFLLFPTSAICDFYKTAQRKEEAKSKNKRRGKK